MPRVSGAFRVAKERIPVGRDATVCVIDSILMYTPSVKRIFGPGPNFFTAEVGDDAEARSRHS